MITTAKGIKSLFFILALTFAVGCIAEAAASEAGIVIAVSGEAGVRRDSTYTALKIKAPVFVEDVVETGPDGKVQILFNDDTSLSVASSSSVSLDEFVFDESSEPSFSVKAIKGISRVISGKIVERNPDGFGINSPRASVGIRGTGVLVSVEKDKDVILLQHIGPGHNVLVTGLSGITTELTRPGTAVDVFSQSGSPQNAYQMSQSQMDALIQAVSVITGREDSGNGIESANESFQPVDPAYITEDMNENNENLDSYLPKDMNNAYVPPANDIPEENPSGPSTASYAGVLKSSESSDTVGAYGFNVDLDNLKISDAYLFGSHDRVGAFLATGGSGTVSSEDNSFSAGNFAGFSANGIYTGADGAFMQGTFSEDGEKNYISLWELSKNGDALASGTGEGSRVPSFEIPDSIPTNIMAFYAGTLNSENAQIDGVFGFALDLQTLGISGAYMTGSKNGTGSFLASGGTGLLSSSDYSFAIDSFVGITANGRFKKATGALISGSLSADGESAAITQWNLNQDGDRIIWGTGEGDRVTYVDIPDYVPANMTAFYEGSLNAENMRMNGVFGFALNLETLGIFGAYVGGSKNGTGAFLASGGTGTLSASDYSFAIGSFADINANGRFNGATGALLSGSISDDGQEVAVNNWNLNQNNDTIIWGTGEGNSSELIETPEYEPALLTASYSGAISGVHDGNTVTGSFGMNIDLIEGAVSNAFMYGQAPVTLDTVTDSFIVNNGTGALDSSGNFAINNFNAYGNRVTGAMMNGTLKNDFSGVVLNDWQVDLNNFSVFRSQQTTEAGLVNELPSAPLLTGTYGGNLYNASGQLSGEYSVFMDFFASEAYKIYVRISNGENGAEDLLISKGAGYMSEGFVYASFGPDTVIVQGDSSLSATLEGSVLSDNAVEFIVRDSSGNTLDIYRGGSVVTGPAGFDPSKSLTARYEGTVPTNLTDTFINFYFDLAFDSARDMSIENVTMYGTGDGFFGSGAGFGSFLIRGGSGSVTGAPGSYTFVANGFTGSLTNPENDVLLNSATLEGAFSSDMMSLADVIADISMTVNGADARFHNRNNSYGFGDGQMVSGIHARFDGVLTNGGVNRGNFGFDVNLNNGDIKNVSMYGNGFHNVGGFGTKGPDGTFRAEDFTNPLAANSSAAGAFMDGNIHGNIVDVSGWQAVDPTGYNFVSGDGGYGNRVK